MKYAALTLESSERDMAINDINITLVEECKGAKSERKCESANEEEFCPVRAHNDFNENITE